MAFRKLSTGVLHWQREIAAVLFLIIIFFIELPHGNASQGTLDYLCRYEHQSGEPDHLLDAIAIDEHRAIVAGNRGLALIDLDALPVNGTKQYLYRLTGLNARDLYLKYPYVFVNLHRGESEGPYGFAVVKIVGNTLQKITIISEENALLEKMCLKGNNLYVAAHNKGIRIYDISQPENPALVGRLDNGFIDAFAIAVANDTAFVADGGGGLKIVDVSDKTNPQIIAGETLETAVGTGESVAYRNGTVFLAAGGAGVAVYKNGDIYSRKLVQIGGAAEDMCLVGDFLVVSNLQAITVLKEESPGEWRIYGREITARRGSGILRLAEGVGAASNHRVLCANWNYMDVYQIKPAAQSTQPDIYCSVQRIRFSPEGGTKSVTIKNDGGGDLIISEVGSNSSFFSATLSPTTLSAGQSRDFQISYAGGETNASGVISIRSNDPDEDPLPIQVFGRTQYLDPGEEAIDFSLPAFRYNRMTGEMEEETFTLSNYRGKIVWFSVYGSW